MCNLILKTINTNKLNVSQIKDICILKNQHWKYGLKSQLKWFKLNCKKSDLHNLLLDKKKIIGYTLLRKRLLKKNNKAKMNFLYFDTFIIDKKFRNKKYATIMMSYNNFVILRKNFEALLICNKDILQFYKKNGWKKIISKNIEITNHKPNFFKPHYMIFNKKSSLKKFRSISI